VGDPQTLQGDAALACAEARDCGVPIEPWRAEAPLQGVLVDALLGTGLTGAVREPYASAIAAINASGRPVLAIDLPSGLCANTGQVLGQTVRADLSVTFIGLKLGLFTAGGPDRVGALVFDDLQADPGTVAQVASEAVRLDHGSLARVAPRSPTAHKGSFGQVLVIGGDLGTGGAALLSAEAALRCGAGMVTLATRPEHVSASLVRRPEVMCNGVESTYSLTALLERADVLVVGPGLGQAPWGRSLISAAAQREQPQVWDADALNLLATGAVELPSGCLITPHPGEAARLLQCSVGEVQADRPAAARALAQRQGGRHAGRGAGWPAGPVRSRPSGDGQCRARRRAGRSARCLAGAAAGAVRGGLPGRLAARRRR